MKDTQYLTPREVASRRRRTEAALAHERKRHQGPPYVLDGRRVLYPVDDLERWLETNLDRRDPS